MVRSPLLALIPHCHDCPTQPAMDFATGWFILPSSDLCKHELCPCVSRSWLYYWKPEWSSGMILALGAGGLRFKPGFGPCIFCATGVSCSIRFLLPNWVSEPTYWHAVGRWGLFCVGCRRFVPFDSGNLIRRTEDSVLVVPEDHPIGTHLGIPAEGSEKRKNSIPRPVVTHSAVLSV